MRSRIFYFLALILALVGLYVVIRDDYALTTVLRSILYFLAGYVCLYIAVRAGNKERWYKYEKEWKQERELEDKNLELTRERLVEAGYEMRSKSKLCLRDTEDGGQVIELTTSRGVNELYPCSSLLLEVVPGSKLRVYKNSIVAFVFYESLKTNGLYYIKVRA